MEMLATLQKLSKFLVLLKQTNNSHTHSYRQEDQCHSSGHKNQVLNGHPKDWYMELRKATLNFAESIFKDRTLRTRHLLIL